ncbi:MAG TPA: neutral zinc metallopeptidase [Xanthobacteraceae bacterium]|nr:neutral zinc metallopeptidase [Xanthobacteraceae bacterium]
MRTDDWRTSDNIEDRREDGDGGYGGGGGFGLPVGGGLGIGGLVVLGLLGWALGIDPRLLIGGGEILSRQSPYQQPYRPPIQRRPSSTTTQPSDSVGKFVGKVLAANEDRWKEIFAQSNQRYQAPHLVLFRGRTSSACGLAQSAMGPFYCPSDRRIYLDTSFFGELERRFHGCEGKACQFSEAYVIAHEYGHHVQNLLGILPKVQQMQHGVVKSEANRLQVRVELQADCLAGVWANRQQQKEPFLDPGDVEAALTTASAIGDDRLQRQARGVVMPDSFTHGSSEQRVRWFNTGLKNGTVDSCNTFAAAKL